MGTGFFISGNNNSSSNKPIYAWRIRPAKPLYVYNVINARDQDVVIDFNPHAVQYNESQSLQQQLGEPYNTISSGEHIVFDHVQDEGKIDVYYWEGHGFNTNKNDFAATFKVEFYCDTHEIYDDWEIKLSTNPELYPQYYDYIVIDDIEYECEFLGEQNIITE